MLPHNILPFFVQVFQISAILSVFGLYIVMYVELSETWLYY